MCAGGVRGVGHGPLEHLDRERGEASPGEECAELKGGVEGRARSRVRADRSEPLSRRVGTALHRRALHRLHGEQARIVVAVEIRPVAHRWVLSKDG